MEWMQGSTLDMKALREKFDKDGCVSRVKFRVRYWNNYSMQIPVRNRQPRKRAA
jgi:hypothetical protein